ncbi:MAG: hypothetical protein ACRDRT_14870 [Pseudonocardiaceae bacterium]
MLTGLRRLFIIAILASVAFVLALIRFQNAPANDCLGSATTDDSYALIFVTPPSRDTVDYKVRVTRDGSPVAGARVCMNVAMGGMSAMGLINRAREVTPGIYEARAAWQMGGLFEGKVLVKESGKGAVAVPISFNVP